MLDSYTSTPSHFNTPGNNSKSTLGLIIMPFFLKSRSQRQFVSTQIEFLSDSSNILHQKVFQVFKIDF